MSKTRLKHAGDVVSMAGEPATNRTVVSTVHFERVYDLVRHWLRLSRRQRVFHSARHERVRHRNKLCSNTVVVDYMMFTLAVSQCVLRENTLPDARKGQESARLRIAV